MLIGQTTRGPLRGPQSTPGALCGKKFCLQKWGLNNSESSDLSKSTIVKNTSKIKTLKFFNCIDFDAKMVYVADLDCSADANSGMRQVLYFFPEWFCPYEEIQGECSSDKVLGGPYGGPKVPPGPYAEKNFVFKSRVQTTQNALICLDPLSWKTLFWKKNLKIFYLGHLLCRSGDHRRFWLFCRC